MTSRNHEPRPHKSASLQAAGAALILLMTAIIALWLLKTPPKVRPRPHIRVEPLVEVVAAKSSATALRLYALATVIADQAVSITPRVSGQVEAVSANFTPGGLVNRGEVLLTIDPEDYRLAVTRQRGKVAEARAALTLEMGNQLVAQKEFELLGRRVNPKERQLMLRKPQLDAARAGVTAAEAGLAMAGRDLTDTEVRAPFNATILSRAVSRGSRVSTSTPLAELVGTDAFLLRITLPEEQLTWISAPPDTPSPVTILSGDRSRRGVVTNITASLEENSRMAVLYARVNDPLSLKESNRDKPQLRLGSLVRVVVGGPVLSEMAVIDRSLLRADNTVRIVDHNCRFALRPVTVAARDGDRLYLSAGISPGDLLVVPPTSSPHRELEPATAADRGEQTAADKKQPRKQPARGEHPGPRQEKRL